MEQRTNPIRRIAGSIVLAGMLTAFTLWYLTELLRP